MNDKNDTLKTAADIRRTERRKENCDRRAEADRRKENVPVAEDRRQSVVDRRIGLDRRRGPGHRLTEERRDAEEGRMNDEQFDFLMAIDRYKKENQRPFPTWTEVLEIIRALGYRKVAEPQSLKSFKKESEPAEVTW